MQVEKVVYASAADVKAGNKPEVKSNTVTVTVAN
jgi:hypothetical protein